MNLAAMILSILSLVLSIFLFVVVRKVIEAMKIAGEALEEMARLLERNL